MTKSVVSVVKFEDAYRDVKRVLELCDGLQGFRAGDRILIKPNLVSWDFELPFPPFGVVTTSSVMEALVRVLAEHGFNNLTIGEAPLPGIKPKGQAIFEVLGYRKLQERYGVKLVDFNEEEFVPVDFGEFNLRIAQKALEADRIIDLPVLKTHNQAKVSLGIKNLKGCLHVSSKMLCHGVEPGLEQSFPRIIEKLPVALTLIDGVFALEKGPAPTGKAFRRNLLIASGDTFAADVTGAQVMGYAAADIAHLRFFAARHGRSLDPADIEFRGENPADHVQFVDYDWAWTAEDTGPRAFKRLGMEGLAVRKYDESLCTGCSAQFNPMLILLMSAFQGQRFPDVELVSGKKQLAREGFEKTVLFGRCACELNRDNPAVKEAILLKGCPPSLKSMVEGLAKDGIQCVYDEYVKYRHHLFDRYKDKEGFDLGLYTVR
ncbi:MAG TPA: DUF362 domain-containing protein [Spirochaetia bacterium]|nr:DUF362 domain-containing protein [Spirochaetia bacterium]